MHHPTNVVETIDDIIISATACWHNAYLSRRSQLVDRIALYNKSLLWIIIIFQEKKLQLAATGLMPLCCMLQDRHHGSFHRDGTVDSVAVLCFIAECLNVGKNPSNLQLLGLFEFEFEWKKTMPVEVGATTADRPLLGPRVITNFDMLHPRFWCLLLSFLTTFQWPNDVIQISWCNLKKCLHGLRIYMARNVLL